MIDLSYKSKTEKKNDDWNPVIQAVILVMAAAFLAVMVLSGIAGEFIF